MAYAYAVADTANTHTMLPKGIPAARVAILTHMCTADGPPVHQLQGRAVSLACCPGDMHSPSYAVSRTARVRSRNRALCQSGATADAPDCLAGRWARLGLTDSPPLRVMWAVRWWCMHLLRAAVYSDGLLAVHCTCTTIH
jgi:hypothetical protein